MKLRARQTLLALSFCAISTAPANAAELSKTVNGIEIHYGVVSAQVVKKTTDKHDPRMHGGKPRSGSSHHLVVSLFDAKTGERIEDATVVATVTPLGLAPATKRLDPMQVNDTKTYGNFFDFPASSSPFRIALKIARRGIPEHNAINAEFEYRPPDSK